MNISICGISFNDRVDSAKEFNGKNVIIQWCLFDTMPGFLKIKNCELTYIQYCVFTRSFAKVAVNLESVDAVIIQRNCFSLCIRNESANIANFSGDQFGTVLRVQKSAKNTLEMLSFVACASIYGENKERYIVRLEGKDEESTHFVFNINSSRNFAYYGAGIHMLYGNINKYQNCIYDSCRNEALLIYILDCEETHTSNLIFLNNIIYRSNGELMRIFGRNLSFCKFVLKDSIFIGNCYSFLISALNAEAAVLNSTFIDDEHINNTGNVTFVTSQNKFEPKLSLMHIRFAYDCLVWSQLESRRFIKKSSLAFIVCLISEGGKYTC